MAETHTDRPLSSHAPLLSTAARSIAIALLQRLNRLLSQHALYTPLLALLIAPLIRNPRPLITLQRRQRQLSTRNNLQLTPRPPLPLLQPQPTPQVPRPLHVQELLVLGANLLTGGRRRDHDGRRLRAFAGNSRLVGVLGSKEAEGVVIDESLFVGLGGAAPDAVAVVIAAPEDRAWFVDLVVVETGLGGALLAPALAPALALIFGDGCADCDSGVRSDWVVFTCTWKCRGFLGFGVNHRGGCLDCRKSIAEAVNLHKNGRTF